MMKHSTTLQGICGQHYVKTDPFITFLSSYPTWQKEKSQCYIIASLLHSSVL